MNREFIISSEDISACKRGENCILSLPQPLLIDMWLVSGIRL